MSAGVIWRTGIDTKDSLKVLIDRFADQDGGSEWTGLCRISLLHARHALMRNALPKVLPKIHLSGTQTVSLLLLFRPDLVIAQLAHENFFVYRLPGVVEHRRDASRAANF